MTSSSLPRLLCVVLVTTATGSFSGCDPNESSFSALPVQTQALATDPGSSPTSTSSSSSSSGGGSTCTVQNTPSNLRILFMVDNSNSTDTTDPDDTERVATVQTFLTNYGTKTNLNYSYSFFSSDVETYNMASASPGFTTTPAQPFGDSAQAQNALNAFKQIRSMPTTQYKVAFNSLTELVTNDLSTGGIAGYVVLFMSDGQPTDLGPACNGGFNDWFGGGNQNCGSAQSSAITQLVSQLRSVTGPDRLTVSAIFFGDSDDTTSVQNLSAMATAGGGQFVNTNVTTQVSIDDVLTVPNAGCP